MQSALWSLVVSFMIMMIVGPACLNLLDRWRFMQTERDFGPASHLKKQGTLTMGGLIMLLAFCVSSLIFASSYDRTHTLLSCLLFVLGFSTIGFLDDYIKVALMRSLGLKPWQKIALQIVLALGFALYCYFNENIGSRVIVPILNTEWDLGLWYVPFNMLITIAVINSANLNDGVDGLLSSVTTVITVTLMLIALFMKASAINTAVADTAMVLCASMAGSCLGFMRYNAHPARVFMGDVGSFQLGAVVAVASLVLRVPLVLPLVAVTYLVSSLSDILQAASYKFRHKRLFRMAPLHHHFELGGMSEPRIVAMYTAATAMCCILTLLALGL